MTQSSVLENTFFAALAITSDAARRDYLDDACAGNTGLREQVEKMLAAHFAAGEFLEQPAVTVNQHTQINPAIIEAAGSTIGPYKLLQQIGEGGMGVVFMAEQFEPIRRIVALKIIKQGMDTRQVIARFEAERQALATMDHPNVAKVLDAGTTAGGRPYFVMELVKGVPITKYCDDRKLPLRARLDLFVPVCMAVQHAHQKGLIHRDIKPTNVLVAEYDDLAVPKVIDFGVAKAIAQPMTDRTLFTEYGQVVGTVEYMSPEQAKLNQLDIDTRSDIYSLGVLLYELLTGSTPFGIKRLKEAAFDEMLRIIREEEPEKPSTRLSTVDAMSSIAANRGMETLKLNRQVRGELDWIAMKCLEKERSRRYDTPNELAAEILRYLADEPITAGAPSTRYRLQKFVTRNKGALASAIAIAASLIIATAVSVWFGVREREQRAEAEAQRAEAVKQRGFADENANKEIKARARAEAINAFVTKSLKSSDPMADGKRDATIAQAMKNSVAEIDSGAFKDEPEIEAAMLLTIADVLFSNGQYEAAEPLYQRSLAIREQVLGPEDPQVASCLNNLAGLYNAQGRYASAEPLYLRSLAIAEKALGPDHKDVANTLNNLTALYVGQGQYAKAEPLIKRALILQERVLGPDHTDVAASLNNLAQILDRQGQFAEAEPLYRRSLSIVEKAFGKDHPFVGVSLNNLAFLLAKQNQYAAAEPLYKRSLEIWEATLGPDHPNVAASLNNLASLYQSQGQYAAAEPLYNRSLAIYEKALGPNHPSISKVLTGMADLYRKLDRIQEAQQLQARAMAIRDLKR